MDPSIKFLDGDRVLIDNKTYKLMKTRAGKYTKEERRRYMKVWRLNRRIKHTLINLKKKAIVYFSHSKKLHLLQA